jgi:exoribonuclease-2
MAPLSAPFKPKDATLFSIISGFDTAYAAYNGFQTGIERFWALRWLQQNEIHELDAAVLKDGLVRADTLPLVFKASGCDALARGTRVRVRVDGVDLLTLDLHAKLVARLDDAPPADAAAAAEETDDIEEAGAGPLTLAIDVDEETPPAEGTATPA